MSTSWSISLWSLLGRGISSCYEFIVVKFFFSLKFHVRPPSLWTLFPCFVVLRSIFFGAALNKSMGWSVILSLRIKIFVSFSIDRYCWEFTVKQKSITRERVTCMHASPFNLMRASCNSTYYIKPIKWYLRCHVSPCIIL